VSKNEILTALNKPDDFILAMVEVPASEGLENTDPWRINEKKDLQYGNVFNGCTVNYVRKPFVREPDFGVTSVNYDIAELLKRAEVPK